MFGTEIREDSVKSLFRTEVIACPTLQSAVTILHMVFHISLLKNAAN